jgi:esterase/lipase superfamily enzyme
MGRAGLAWWALAVLAGCATADRKIGEMAEEAASPEAMITESAPPAAPEGAAPILDVMRKAVGAEPAAPRSVPAMTPGATGAGAGAAPAAETAPFKIQRVFYGTNRATGDPSNPNNHYSGGRTDRVELGFCDVSIPRTHQPGKLEAPDPLTWEYWVAGGFREDPEKHVVLLKVTPQEKAAFLRDLQAAMRAEGNGRKRCFVFVHGYNVPFRMAARRTAQMAHDLGFPGAPIFYSWPSHGNHAYYLADAEQNFRSRPELREFLELVARDTGAQEIHLIAHSMGTRITTNVLPDAYAAMGPFTRPRLKSLILAAPDIDADVFNQEIVPRLAATGIPLTLYASRADKALIAARQVNGKPRVGQDPVLAAGRPGVTVVDASAVRTDFTEHSYFGDSPMLLREFRAIFDGRRPEQREWLSPRSTDAGARYWVLPSRP